MNNSESLVEKADHYAELLDDGSVELLDFDGLRATLREAAAGLQRLLPKAHLADVLLNDFKHLLARKLKAALRAQGNPQDGNYLLSVLEEGDPSYEDLKRIARQIDEEFNRCFGNRPAVTAGDELTSIDVALYK